MKKLSTLLLSFIALSSLSAQNLLVNPSLETWADGKAAPWDFYAAGNANVVYSQETGIVNDGTSAVRIENATNGTTANVSQSYTGELVPGDTYEFSYNYYVVSGDGTDVRIWAGWKSYDNTTSKYVDIEHDWDVLRLGGSSSQDYHPSNTGTWSSYSGETTVPANAKMFDFRVRSYRGSVVIFDNFTFTKKGSSTNPSVTVYPASLDFATTQLNAPASKTFNVKGYNLTGDLSVALSGDNVFTTVSSITKADAEAGYDVNVQYMPTAYGTNAATITINGGGLAQAVTVGLSGSATDPGTITTGNVLVNPSIETWSGGKAEPWDFYAGNNANVVYSQETTIVNDGASAVRIDNPSTGTTANISQSYSDNLIEGNKYALSFDYYVVSGDGTDVRIWSGWKSRNGDTYVDIAHDLDVLRIGSVNSNDYLPSNTGTWSNYKCETTVPAGAAIFDFRVRSYRGSVVIFDNFKLENMTISSIEDEKADAGFNVYATQGYVNVNVSDVDAKFVEVYDILGKQIAKQQLNPELNQVSVPAGQLVIVKVGNVAKKVLTK
ncbi:MAG: carbohydrate binding domain-containing protein [Dysgonomonas sp.]